MIDIDVCPACESCNTMYADSREDDDYKYVIMKCNDCGCEYTCQIVEVITKVMFDNEDGEQVAYLN